MANEHSERFNVSQEADDKFDYFMCAVTGALFGYIAQSKGPASWAELVAAICLAIAFISGLKRIEVTISAKKLQYKIALAHGWWMTAKKGVEAGQPAEDEDGNPVDLKARLAEYREAKRKGEEKFRESIQPWGRRFYAIRNYAVLAGFTFLLLGRWPDLIRTSETQQASTNIVTLTNVVTVTNFVPTALRGTQDSAIQPTGPTRP